MSIDSPDRYDERLQQNCDDQTARFASCGLTLSALHQLLRNEWFIATERVQGMQHRDGLFYLNASDSIPNIRKQDFTGQSVLTVGGSGDFPQTFLDLGAAKVDVFDHSALACFMNELKYLALQLLPYDEYTKLFSPKNPREKTKLFNKEIFDKIKEYLTPQAREFLEAITKPAYEKFFVFDPVTAGCKGPLLAREKIGKKETGAMYPHSSSQPAYESLQQKARTVPSGIFYGDIGSLPVDFAAYDYIYISNIGYRTPQIMEAVRSLLLRGAKRVGFTWQFIGYDNMDEFKISDRFFIDPSIGTAVDKASLNRDHSHVKDAELILMTRDGAQLLPGAEFTYKGMRMRMIGYDYNVLVPCHAEAIGFA